MAKHLKDSFDTSANTEEWAQEIVNKLPRIVFICNVDEGCKLLNVNNACEAITGYSKSQFLNGEVLYIDLIHPDDRKRIKHIYKKEINICEYFDIEYRIIKANGEERLIREQSYHRFDKKLNSNLIEGIRYDVTKGNQLKFKHPNNPELEDYIRESDKQRIATLSLFKNIEATTKKLQIEIEERKVIEKALRESEEQFRLVFRTSPDAISITRISDGLIVDVNQGFTNITSLKREEVVGKTQEEINIWLNIEDRKNFSEELEQKGFVENMEIQFKLKNAKRIVTLVSASPISINGEACMISIAKSIDKIKQVEKELIVAKNVAELYLNISAEIILTLNVNGIITMLNESGHKLLGYEDKELLGKNWFDICIQKSMTGELMKVFANLLNQESRSVETYENEIVTKKGKSKIISWHNSIVKDEFGNVVGTISSGKDITRQKQADKTLKKSEQQLKDLANYMNLKHEAEKTQIAKDIHDGIGQMLTGLKMDMHLISRKVQQSEKIIKSKLDSNIKFIDISLKEVQKLAIQLRPKMLDDLGLIETIMSEAVGFQSKTDIVCKVKFIPEEFTVDYYRSSTIYRILMELLTNTYRYANATKIKIKLEKRSDKYVFTFIDNGIGITENQINDKKSFGIFSIKQRVNRWNGEFSIKGIPDKETTAIISIPF